MKFLRQVAYNVIFFAVFMCTWPYFTYRLWRRGPLQNEFWQRLGFYPDRVKQRLAGGTDLWIHAVSVGETMIAAVLIRHLQEFKPDCRIILSTTTATGYRVAKNLENDRVMVIYNPTDFLWSVRQAFELIRPKRLILIESEIWPNYLWCAQRRGIPVYLANARLSPRSEARYRRFNFFCEPVLQLVSLVFAQDESDVPRLERAGFSPESIFPVGSLKYDVANVPAGGTEAVEEWWPKTGWSDESLILLGGSTHAGEEEILANIFHQMRREWPNLKLVIAPRHAERGGAVRYICERLGLKTVLRSDLAAGSPLQNGSVPDVLIVNSTGELNALYGKATVVFVGKSLRAKGGQNFIEAARVGTPILVGPNLQNFENLAAEFLRRGGLMQVSNEFELSQRVRELLSSEEKRKDLGRKGQETFEANLGAGRRTAEIIYRSLLES